MLTIKDLAEEIGVSKVAINKKVEHLGIKDQLTKAGNRYLLSDEQADRIRCAFEYRKDKPTSDQGDQGDTQQDTPTNEAMLKVIETLTAQLAEKDKQISRLHDLLLEKERSTQQNNFLLADKGGATNAQEVETVSIRTTTDQDRPTQEGHKSFFKRFFG